MRLRTIGSLLLTVGLGSLLAPRVCAQPSDELRAQLVLRLLPESARSDARVVLRDGERERVLRDGGGAFLCVSDASSPGRLSMTCHQRVLEERLRLERALALETDLTGDAFSERVCLEAERTGLKVPAGAMEITGSLSRGKGGAWSDEMTVYHLLWLPGQTEATAGVIDHDPGDGRPWLHQAGMCGAHVMWSEVVRVPG